MRTAVRGQSGRLDVAPVCDPHAQALTGSQRRGGLDRPGDDLEAAILILLAPGNYTGIVRGANDTSGVALVEAYNLDSSL